jgi:hypothetical protein
MKTLTLDTFAALMDAARIKPRLKRDLRFVTSTEHMSETDWSETELLAVTDKSGNKGVVVIELDDRTYVLPCEFKRGITSSSTGRAQPVICDFCSTWQDGSRAGSVAFTHVRNSATNVAYLCCADLACSQHVRTKTSASKISRAQLRENMDDEKRVERLKAKLTRILTSLEAEPVTSA